MEAFELDATFVHLGLGSTATPLPGFTWSAEYLTAYESRFEGDGGDGRLVCISPQSETWDSWERRGVNQFRLPHLFMARYREILEHVIALRPGQALINPANVWHTARVHEPGTALFITPGRGTEHRPLG